MNKIQRSNSIFQSNVTLNKCENVCVNMLYFLIPSTNLTNQVGLVSTEMNINTELANSELYN